MRVSATRTLSTYAVGVGMLAALFVGVVAAQIVVVSGLRGLGLGAGAALGVAGALILAAVVGLRAAAALLRRRSLAARERARVEHALPDGPCCVIWRTGQVADFPFELEGVVSVRYPKAARQLGVEGYAVVDFEVAANGAAKNLHVVDYWPSRLFYDAAVEALMRARFRPRDPSKAWRGPSYRMPFVFRIKGAARVRDKGRRAAAPGSLRWLGGHAGALSAKVLAREPDDVQLR
jgi:TonB family protein